MIARHTFSTMFLGGDSSSSSTENSSVSLIERGVGGRTVSGARVEVEVGNASDLGLVGELPAKVEDREERDGEVGSDKVGLEHSSAVFEWRRGTHRVEHAVEEVLPSVEEEDHAAELEE